MRILEYMIGSTLWIESEKWWIGEDKGENEATSHKLKSSSVKTEKDEWRMCLDINIIDNKSYHGHHYVKLNYIKLLCKIQFY